MSQANRLIKEAELEEGLLEEWRSAPSTDEAKDLYLGHEIKEELAIGPTSLQPPDSAFVPRGRGPDELPPDSTPQHPDTSLVAITHSMQPSVQLQIPYDILDPQKKLHSCETCQKQFVSESMLDNHIARVHTGDKPGSNSIIVNHASKLEGVCFEDIQNGGACFEDIKNGAFSKRILIKRGRCTPDLPLMKPKGKKKQKFNPKFYKLHSWLTGCVHSNRLFCFYCLLFSSGKAVWNDTGYTDVRNLPAAAKKHEQSEKHIEAYFKFKTSGKKCVETSLNSENQIDIDRHNAKVNRNRNIFQRLIDIVCFLGNQDLAFCGHYKSSDNRDIFLEMVNFLAKYDGVLESHLENSTTTSTGLSNQIQADLISSVASVLDDNIKKEISATDFVAVMVDETRDASGNELLVVTLRYIHDSEVCDRFIKYVDISSDRSAKTISDIVLKTLLDFNCLSKLTAQTYDGAALLPSEINDVQSLVRQRSPHAVYVWCFAHELNALLSNACQRIPETKRFFHIIKTLPNFFHNCKRQNHYNKMADLKQLPRFSDAHWTYNSRILNVISNSYSHLIDLFGDMADNEVYWDGETLCQATSLLHHLKEFEFQFLLRVFNEIFVETDALYEIIQNTSCVSYCVDKIKELESFLESLRTRFEVIFEDVKRIAGPPKRKRNVVVEVKDSFRRVFDNILDSIFAECHDRYQNFEELTFFQMLSCKNFAAYNEHFPSELMHEFGNAYKSFAFNVDRLTNELKCIYKTKEFRNMSFFDIIQHFHENRINQVFPESFRLAKLIVTIPASSGSCEKSLSSLKRVHNYLVNTQGQPRQTDLSKISIEKTLLTEIKRLPNFYDSVLQIYLQKDRRSDLIYKP